MVGIHDSCYFCWHAEGCASIILLTAWLIWRHRNICIFDNMQLSNSLLMKAIKDRWRLSPLLSHPSSPTCSPPPTMDLYSCYQHGRITTLGFCSWPCFGRSGVKEVRINSPFFSLSRHQGVLFGCFILFGLLPPHGGFCWNCFAMLHWRHLFWF